MGIPETNILSRKYTGCCVVFKSYKMKTDSKKIETSERENVRAENVKSAVWGRYTQITKPANWSSRVQLIFASCFAGWTGLEPATSAVTGRHSNQLNYQPVSLFGYLFPT